MVDSQVIVEHSLPAGRKIEVCQGDLTLERTDAIVNAANEYLSHGGGVAAAIVRRGGSIIQQESNQLIQTQGRVPTGGVAVTSGGSLSAHYVIHAVVPVWQGGDHQEDELLEQAIRNSLEKAQELQLRSIAIPAVSSGIFGFPKEECAQILIRTAFKFLEQHPSGSLQTIRFTNIDAPTVECFAKALKKAVGIP